MNQSEQTEHLIEELNRVIDRFRKEYHLTYGIAIGCLEMVKLNLWDEAREELTDSE